MVGSALYSPTGTGRERDGGHLMSGSLALDEALAGVLTFGPLVADVVLEGRRFRGDAGRRARDRTYRRLQAWQLGGLAGAVVCARCLTGAALPGPAWAWPVAGCVVGLGGLALRLWAIRSLGGLFTRDLRAGPEHRIVEHGPYRVVRHGAYTGAILLFAGVGLGLGNWLSLLSCAALPTIGYVERISREEALLRQRFGAEYAEYARRTYRLIPGLW